MASNSINFDHTTGTISSNADKTVSVNNKLIIGDGTSSTLRDEETNKLEDGLLCVKKSEETGVPQLYKSNKNGNWEVLGEPYDDSIELIYTIIMGE